MLQSCPVLCGVILNLSALLFKRWTEIADNSLGKVGGMLSEELNEREVLCSQEGNDTEWHEAM